MSEIKGRILVAEISGSESALSQALAGMIAALSAPAPAAEQPPKIALPPPSIEEPRALEPPTIAPVKRSGVPAPAKVKQARQAQAPGATQESAATITGAIRDAVREGPKTNAEVMAYVREHGFPDVDSNTISTILCQRRSANEMYKDDSGLVGKWRLAEKK